MADSILLNASIRLNCRAIKQPGFMIQNIHFHDKKSLLTKLYIFEMKNVRLSTLQPWMQYSFSKQSSSLEIAAVQEMVILW